MKPSSVGVGVPNVEANAAPSEVSVTVSEALSYPVLVVVIVAVELVPGATPVTVTKPLTLLIATEPNVVVPAHV